MAGPDVCTCSSRSHLKALLIRNVLENSVYKQMCMQDCWIVNQYLGRETGRWFNSLNLLFSVFSESLQGDSYLSLHSTFPILTDCGQAKNLYFSAGAQSDLPIRKIQSKFKMFRDFPGGSVVKNLPRNAGEVGLIPGWGTKIPHATEQLSPSTTTTEPQRCDYWRLLSLSTATKDPACYN